MSCNMVSHFCHRLAHIGVRIEQLVMFTSFPVGKSGKLLRDGLEKTDNDTNGCGFHVMAKFVDSSSVLLVVSKKENMN
jgi:hypothetical protein